MADVVQFRLERMADELDDLERRGLFSRAELTEIVRRRRDFEFRLKRPSPLKHDYLAYIDYERRVDALRDLRKRRILGELRREEEEDDDEGEGKKGKRGKKRKKGKKWKKSVSDIAGVLRILGIFRLATMRYKGDLDLWFQYLEFCRERRHGRMKEVLVQAIRFHPNIPGLWIYASAWEFDQNLNVAAARALMQSGLRACPKSEDLWIEYLRMELTYLNKLKARKFALGEDVKTLGRNSNESDQWKEENKDLFMPLNEEGKALPKEGTLEEKEDLFWQQGLLILQTIYHGAIEAIPTSMSLRKQFLEILDSVDLAHSDELKVEVLDDLKKDFSHDEDYWDWIARFQISDALNRKDLSREEVISKLNKAVQVYEEALKLLPTTKMFSLYAQFWSDMLFSDKEDSVSLLNNVGLDASEFTSSILKLYEKAELNECLSEQLACQYVLFYLKTGRLEEARNLAEKLCNGPLSDAAKLWALRSSIELKWFTQKSFCLSNDNLSRLFDLLKHALTNTSISEAESLWLTAMKLFSNNKEYFEKLVKVIILSVAEDGGSDCAATISSAVVNWVLQRDGIQRARETYKRFLALPRPSLKFFKHCIELEWNLASMGNSDALANARMLYESALSFYDQNKELWRNYYQMEMKAGTSETANAVYWRARKTLKDSSALSVPHGL
ncbi:U3 small nucleolar RNA-associated protein 6 homolog [Ananas comosus]|uniref:U3 small nucleolar RNA-associated protein 6 homolog n=1 Tax=Ananas comosus TaxID=4615 RepID=A0A6P5FHV5_ANACO|nr:U3 small nucleolar RNA-associated protein 6 homolog [Ananas comosus]